jgi:hypothetical protein
MDKVPKLHVGAINPFALTEALVGQRVDWTKPESIEVMEDALETDYQELFDMQFDSPLYAGLQLNGDNMAEPVDDSEIVIREDEEKETPDFSEIETFADLKKVGVSDLESLKVKSAVLTRGKLNMNVELPGMRKSLSNKRLSKDLASLVKPNVGTGDWTPSGAVWHDMGDFFKDVSEFSDPIQGSVGNCYFIAAVSAIAWADPYRIVHRNRATGTGETNRVNAIQFYSKGGGKNAPSKLIEVSDKTLVRTSNNSPIYCRSRDSGEIYPALYEKAFAKWIAQSNSDKPNIAATAGGDPVKATAQLNNKTPYYYNTSSRTGSQLWSIVRSNSMSYKTIHPMTAWTYGSQRNYSGTNIVGNHAYTVLGWAYKNSKKYIILRNPWGYREPSGLNTYQGLLYFYDKSFWRPISMIGNDGVFALEANSFQYYFAGIGVAK